MKKAEKKKDGAYERVQTFLASAKRPDVGDDVYVDPSNLSDDERRELIARIKSGETISIDTYLTVFDEAGNNSRHVGLAKGELDALARSASGTPFMKDHSGSTDMVVGTVQSGMSVNGELGLSIKLQDPVFMERFVRGLVNSFSVGLGYDGLSCSICEKKYSAEDFWGMLFFEPGCKHRPGKKYNGETCKMLAHGAELVECSAVFSGAYKANRIGHSEGRFAMDMEEAVKEIEALREALAERDEKISKFSEEAYANKAALDDANLKLAEMAKREFDSKLNDGIKCGKVGPKQRALFERLFQEKGHCGDLDEFLELTDEGAAHTAAFANLSGELGADVAGDAKSGLGLVKLYKGEKK